MYEHSAIPTGISVLSFLLHVVPSGRQRRITRVHIPPSPAVPTGRKRHACTRAPSVPTCAPHDVFVTRDVRVPVMRCGRRRRRQSEKLAGRPRFSGSALAYPPGLPSHAVPSPRRVLFFYQVVAAVYTDAAAPSTYAANKVRRAVGWGGGFLVIISISSPLSFSRTRCNCNVTYESVFP